MQDVIKSSPMDKVVVPKYIKPEIDFYEVEDMKKLFDAVECHDILKPAVHLAGRLGLRRSEIVGLRWENVDFENSLINIISVCVRADNEVITKKPKNKTSQRKLAMDPVLRRILLDTRKRQLEKVEEFGELYSDSGYVVVTLSGDRINPGYLSHSFTKFTREMELSHITLHGLRHSVASIAIESGVSIYDTSKLLGHSDISTTSNIYAHQIDGTNSRATSKVADALNNANF